MSAVALRLRYEIVGKVRFVGSRDLSRIWERTLRRVGVPVAYSQGFTPRPRLSFGLALPTCAASSAEYVDVRLSESLDSWGGTAGIGTVIDDALPDGLAVHAAALVDASGPSLQESVTAVTWEMTDFEQSSEQLSAAAASTLTADELLLERERKGSTTVDDIRPAIIDIAVDAPVDDAVDDPASSPRVIADVASVGRSLRPAELARAVFGVDDAANLRIHRVAQWTDGVHGRSELLPPPDRIRSLSAC
ncbi:MAG: TIGR03936 family radical SAM-associated protein [Actinomycetota bacterium]